MVGTISCSQRPLMEIPCLKPLSSPLCSIPPRWLNCSACLTASFSVCERRELAPSISRRAASICMIWMPWSSGARISSASKSNIQHISNDPGPVGPVSLYHFTLFRDWFTWVWVSFAFQLSVSSNIRFELHWKGHTGSITVFC